MVSDGGNTLYVADTLDNRIAAIPNAALRVTGRTVTRGGALNSELGLAIAPNGDILTVNGGDGNIDVVSGTIRRAREGTRRTTGTARPAPRGYAAARRVHAVPGVTVVA